MDYFEGFTSNTLAGSGNQHFFLSDDSSVRMGRLFFRLYAGGTFRYSFLFSNVIDSTFSDGRLSHKNLICDGWTIHGMSATVCDREALQRHGDGCAFLPLTFGGSLRKEVAPGEFFATDPVELTADGGQYLCLEIAFSGRMIPYHEESVIPTFLRDGAGWQPSKHLPFPGMVGCDRTVKRRIVFWGDSITQGIGVPQDSYAHWNAVLAESVGPAYAWWNLGLGFARAEDAASGGAWAFKAAQNDVAVVCFGVNDIYCGFSEEKILQDLAAAVDLLKAKGMKVLLQTVPPFNFEGPLLRAWEGVNRHIKTELAARCDGVFDVVPVLGESAERPWIAKYGGHPDAEGCAAWAAALRPALLALLEDGER